MADYNASFTGGSVDPLTGAIYAEDTLHSNKTLTITFTSSCPGGGLDGNSGTSVRFSGSCATALQNAVAQSRKVDLNGTKSGVSLSNVNHQIM